MASISSKTIIIGISGPSSSGKTTLARLLRDIFNITTKDLSISLFIVHEDDFYKTDVDIPWRTWTSPNHGPRRLQDWDCVESLDLPLIERIVTYIKEHGTLPADFASKEDQNSIGDTHISQSEIAKYHDSVGGLVDQLSQRKQANGINELRICILEGFLLFPPPRSVLTSWDSLADTTSQSPSTSTVEPSQLANILNPNIDVKIFLPSTKELTISRRAARSGYVTLEGFWEDPPGYVEEVVWPNYVRDQGWLFDGAEDVDGGKVNIDRAKQEGILVGPGRGNQGMKPVLSWGVDLLKAQIQDMFA